MTFTRREAFAVLAGAGVLSGCGNSAARKTPVPPPTSSTDRATRLIARAGFGARPGEAEEVRKLGADKWIVRQLNPTSDEPFDLQHRLARLDIFRFSAWELRDWKEFDIIRQLQQAALLSAALSPWQVRERMIDFWSNHFNIYAKKGLSAYRLPSAYRNVIQANALGSFPKMLHASAKSTAMLLYLDQQASHKGNPNENYARELLELHTLGVDAGYSQKDVMEVARCFTGWTEERRFLREKGSFRFYPELHDDGEKLVLGEVIPAGGGVKDGERVLDILARHPATARHLAQKLVKFFLGREAVALEVAVEDAYWGEQ
ncbi:MAG: DUF1800 domain-containing protein, partial [Chloroflexi bacterium]|nr:DUF1800 domain-containing protein [Chloroflexota bacterium]